MKAFLEEYGLDVVVIIVVAALLGVGLIVAKKGSKGLENTFNRFTDKAEEAMNKAEIDTPVTPTEDGNN